MKLSIFNRKSSEFKGAPAPKVKGRFVHEVEGLNALTTSNNRLIDSLESIKNRPPASNKELAMLALKGGMVIGGVKIVSDLISIPGRKALEKFSDFVIGKVFPEPKAQEIQTGAPAPVINNERGFEVRRTQNPPQNFQKK